MSQPDETHGCAYCGEEHPARMTCPAPEPEEDFSPVSRTRYDAALDALLSDPAALDAFVKSCRARAGAWALPGGAATDSADRSGESLHLAGGRGSAAVPGPTSMVVSA